MKQFNVPEHYRSSFISEIKKIRKAADPRKKDLRPSLVDFGSFSLVIPRHFGFCYGVENAIEIAHRTLREHPDRRIFMVSEMIHNPVVNTDLQERGLHFLYDTSGNALFPLDTLEPRDIVMIPAFGTTREMEKILAHKGIDTRSYDTTCPFVERVWKAGAKLGSSSHTIIIHGKLRHEETRATFSHSSTESPTLIIENIAEARLLLPYIHNPQDSSDFFEHFQGRTSPGFDPTIHLSRIGVINQTTMLATETQAIADLIRQAFISRYGPEYHTHFADTRDTLCYATLENQLAIDQALLQPAQAAFIIGGYNSSNTAHLVELCEQRMPTFFISQASCLLPQGSITHYNIHSHQQITSTWPPHDTHPPLFLLGSGASCPDASLDEIITTLCTIFPGTANLKDVLRQVSHQYPPLPS